MIRKVYNLEAFNASRARSMELVAMVASDYEGTVIANIDAEGNPNEDYKGVSLCESMVDNRFSVTIEGKKYTFNFYGEGYANTESEGWKLIMATISEVTSVEGDGISYQNSLDIEIEGEGGVTTTETNTEEVNTVIDTLSAKDEMALQMLGKILDKVPAMLGISKTVKDYYCEQAYDWAERMLIVAALHRGEDNEETVLNPVE